MLLLDEEFYDFSARNRCFCCGHLLCGRSDNIIIAMYGFHHTAITIKKYSRSIIHNFQTTCEKQKNSKSIKIKIHTSAELDDGKHKFYERLQKENLCVWVRNLTCDSSQM
jgi:hypothetical protein